MYDHYSPFIICPPRRLSAVGVILLYLFCLIGGAPSVHADDAPVVASGNASLSSEDVADIARIEDYLNSVTTMKARFIQMSSTGETSEGDFLLWRPGRLRIAYDPPTPVIITVDGLFLVYHDTELDQRTHIPLIGSPMSVLVEESVHLNGEELTVTGIRRGANTLDVSVLKRDDPAAGRITLVFTDRPLRLQRWVVLDAQGITTNFALVNSQTGVTFDPALFVSNAPIKQRDR